jgi:pimeloyl-ACP methyl ester carboxylesterase
VKLPETRGFVRGLIVALAAASVAVAAAATGGGSSSAATARTLAERSALGAIDPGRGTAARAARDASCGSTPGIVCTSVVVPLDRTGAVAGSISLHVEELPATGTPRGVIFLIAGGPGQGSAHTFSLGDPAAAQLYRYMFPGYTLVAYDDRGTGQSGLLDCPALQVAQAVAAEQTAAAACGAQLGATAPFYSTATHADDLEAVRVALGLGQVGLWGVSYGTKLAMAYALAYPQNVSRLLLDSVLPPEQPDPYEASVLQTMAATLKTLCSTGGCNGAAFSANVVALANKLAAAPLSGKVLKSNGKQATERVDGIELLSVVLDSDLNPGLAAELPAVVSAALHGNTQPLLRLAYLHDAGNEESAIDLSSALYAATVCRDGPFPWDPSTPPEQRAPILQNAIATAPAGTFGPFGTWAAQFGNADFCIGWPVPTGNAPLGAGPLPNVPMLAVSGGYDMRTPTNGAASVAARFPQGHLLVVPGVGHSTTTADPSGCAINAVRAWSQGQTPPSTCPVTPPLVVPVPGIPAAGSVHPLRTATARVTYAEVNDTIHDAEALWLMTAGESGQAAKVAGIYGGTLNAAARSFTLKNYSITHGVTVSGTLKFTKFGPPLQFQGAVTVSGAAAAHGVLGLEGATLSGSLGGRKVP